MNLKNLVGVLNSGNIALGSKLASLLTDDCVILEYTDKSVLFIKGGKLVNATFKTPLNEAMNSEHILENEIVTISSRELNTTLKSLLNTVVENLVINDLVVAEEKLTEFCETFYQFNILKLKCPEMFVENLVRFNKGFSVRKKATECLEAFKRDLFTAAVVEEAITSKNLSALTSVLEKHGVVLALGKDKIKPVVTDALLGNNILAESVTSYLYTIAEDLKDANDDLNSLSSSDYDLEGGSYPDEDNVESEDYSQDEPSLMDDDVTDSEPKEFEPFDPSSLSEEDVRELHKATLKSILIALKDFVTEKASDLEDSNIPPDLDETIVADLDSLEDPELSDSRLSEIEARWQPMIGYFLDSEYHTPEAIAGDFGDESSVDSQLLGTDGSEEVDNLNTDNSEGSSEELPGLNPDENKGV
jgi:hypothetical protein